MEIHWLKPPHRVNNLQRVNWEESENAKADKEEGEEEEEEESWAVQLPEADDQPQKQLD